MRVFTSHIRPDTFPVLVAEGFSIGAALFGWLWLLWQRAWIPAALFLAADLILSRAAPAAVLPALWLGMLLVQGLFGRDLVRWSLARRGFAAGPVVAAPDSEAALLRLLSERADLRPALDRVAV